MPVTSPRVMAMRPGMRGLELRDEGLGPEALNPFLVETRAFHGDEISFDVVAHFDEGSDARLTPVLDEHEVNLLRAGRFCANRKVKALCFEKGIFIGIFAAQRDLACFVVFENPITVVFRS